MRRRKQKKKKPTKKQIINRELIINALVDLAVGIILIALDKLFK